MSCDIRPVETEAEVRACFALMRQLRPHLASADELVERWRLQQDEHYHLAALWQDGKPAALAGWRLQHNLVHGRFLYVDDLVTDETQRGSGHGAALIAWLKAKAAALGCARLTLDTPMNNYLGHRFYFRTGLLAMALRFNAPIA